MDVEQRALIQQLETNATCYELLGEKELPRLLRRAASALTPPDGFVLVPVDPTEVMVNYGTHSCQWITPLEGERIYKAMLAACPEVKP